MCFEIPVKHISRRRCSFSRGRTNSSFLFCFESCYAIKMFMILPLTNLTSTMSLAVTANRGNHENSFVFTDRGSFGTSRSFNKRHLRIYHLSQLIKLKNSVSVFLFGFGTDTSIRPYHCA